MRNPELLRHLIIDISFFVEELSEGHSKRFYLWGPDTWTKVVNNNKERWEELATTSGHSGFMGLLCTIKLFFQFEKWIFTRPIRTFLNALSSLGPLVGNGDGSGGGDNGVLAGLIAAWAHPPGCRSACWVSKGQSRELDRASARVATAGVHVVGLQRNRCHNLGTDVGNSQRCRRWTRHTGGNNPVSN
jgi:hypothetical protein